MDIKRKLKHGSYSVVITVVFVAIAILLNVVFNMLFGNFNLRFDLTERGLYSIEADTAEYLAALDDTINIYFCSTEERFTGLGIEFSQTHEIAKRFAEANRSFTVAFTDRLTNPAFAAKFGGNLTDTNIVIESEKTGRFRVLRESEYIIYEFFANGERIPESQAYEMYMMQWGQFVDVDVSAGAEQAFLSAIMFVADLEPVRVAFTQGFGESNYSAMYNILHNNGYVVEEINMLTAPELDPEIDFLVIFAPIYDYSADARARVSSWLDNEGMYGKNLLYFPAPEMPETPSLDALTAEWGLVTEYGHIRQSNPNFAFDAEGYMQFLTITGDEFTDEGVLEAPLVGTFIRPVTPSFESVHSIVTSVLAETLPGTITVFDPENYTVNDAFVSAIAMSRKTRYEGLTEFSSRVIVFGSPTFFFAETLMTPQFSNAQFLLNIFNDISGRSDIASQVRVIPKSFNATMFDITAGQANTIAIFFVIIIPLLIIAAGLVVFFRRRYK
ncbi:MAG: GldG family protein [Oscillospiraceae bacterium]|nr:GldG family protein [Oscillospiraceae bacterium]